MNALRALRLFLWLLVPVAAFVAAGYYFTVIRAPADSGGVAVNAPLGGPFQLVDGDGKPVTESIFRDEPSAVFFGFTHCPDVCPTALSDMAQWIDALGADADRMRFVFVTVDPERDTPEVMKEYVGAFSPKIMGVTGEPAKVTSMLDDYHIYYRKVPTEGGDYSMDHSASIFLLNERGELTGTISPDESGDSAVAKLKRLVAG
ncbi:SCO family protein [Propylenella binzhouense]|uniref:SCO family protein n=1 Tax=Propylenella binzhouense TaxID=2555902 RepID=A0A964WSG6_9HYPH|nr:SCO family protein [Propylenella binzhouense]MYZ46790.1 SCO family protein [Propylenella binzhouense]